MCPSKLSLEEGPFPPQLKTLHFVQGDRGEEVRRPFTSFRVTVGRECGDPSLRSE